MPVMTTLLFNSAPFGAASDAGRLHGLCRQATWASGLYSCHVTPLFLR
jgi:hypothetical protein